jgi:hypothetical protein
LKKSEAKKETQKNLENSEEIGKINLEIQKEKLLLWKLKTKNLMLQNIRLFNDTFPLTPLVVSSGDDEKTRLEKERDYDNQMKDREELEDFFLIPKPKQRGESR